MKGGITRGGGRSALPLTLYKKEFTRNPITQLQRYRCRTGPLTAALLHPSVRPSLGALLPQPGTPRRAGERPVAPVMSPCRVLSPVNIACHWRYELAPCTMDVV